MNSNKILGTVYLFIALLLIVLLTGILKKGDGGLFSNMPMISAIVDQDDDESSSFITATNDFSAKDVKNIKAELRVLPLEITESEDDKIHIEFKGKASEFCTAYLREGKLSLIEKKKSLVSGRVQLRLPASWDKGLDLECVSGAVSSASGSSKPLSFLPNSGSSFFFSSPPLLSMDSGLLDLLPPATAR